MHLHVSVSQVVDPLLLLLESVVFKQFVDLVRGHSADLLHVRNVALLGQLLSGALAEQGLKRLQPQTDEVFELK